MRMQEKLRLKARSERFKDHLAGLPTTTTGNSKPAASSASDIEAKKKVAPPQFWKSGQAAGTLGTARDVMQGCIIPLHSCNARQHCICVPEHQSIMALNPFSQLRVRGSTLCQCERSHWMLQVFYTCIVLNAGKGRAVWHQDVSLLCLSVNESRMKSSGHGTGEGA